MSYPGSQEGHCPTQQQAPEGSLSDNSGAAQVRYDDSMKQFRVQHDTPFLARRDACRS